jgi:hypothetical protein
MRFATCTALARAAGAAIVAARVRGGANAVPNNRVTTPAHVMKILRIPSSLFVLPSRRALYQVVMSDPAIICTL